MPNATTLVAIVSNKSSGPEYSNSSRLVFNFKKPAAGAACSASRSAKASKGWVALGHYWSAPHGDGPNGASSRTVRWSPGQERGPLGRESRPSTLFFMTTRLALALLGLLHSASIKHGIAGERANRWSEKRETPIGRQLDRHSHRIRPNISYTIIESTMSNPTHVKSNHCGVPKSIASVAAPNYCLGSDQSKTGFASQQSSEKFSPHTHLPLGLLSKWVVFPNCTRL